MNAKKRPIRYNFWQIFIFANKTYKPVSYLFSPCSNFSCSIHEVILIPDDGDMDVEFLLSMVVSVNKDGVLPEDKLTDSVYYYDAEKNEFSRCNK